MPKVELGEFPERPPGRINDLVWNLLEKCWSTDPEERPLVAEISSAFSNLSFRPEVDRAPLGQIAMAGELERVPSLAPSSRSNGTSISPKRRLIRKSPNRLGLQLQCIRFSQDQPKGRRFYVKLKYGKQSHTTSLTEHIGHSDEYTWFVFVRSCPFNAAKSHAGPFGKVGWFSKRMYSADADRWPLRC